MTKEAMEEAEYTPLTEAEIRLEAAIGIAQLEQMLQDEMDEWWYGEG